jgi:hypothetical protein
VHAAREDAAATASDAVNRAMTLTDGDASPPTLLSGWRDV